MRAFLLRHWFLVGLVVLLPLAFVMGANHPPEWSVQALQQLPTSYCTAAILFLMSVTLKTERLLDALRKPKAVSLAFLVNQAAVPLLALPLLGLQTSADLRVGLLIAACVPCTMASASVWTRRAAGNDAVSLLVTLSTNGLCFLITPFWLAVGTRWFGTAEAAEGLGFGAMVTRLTLGALLPAMLGQLARKPARVCRFVDDNKPWFSNGAQCIILTLVFVSAFRGAVRFEGDGMIENLRHAEFATVWICCIALHCAAMVVAWTLSGAFGLPDADRRACVIAGSQKTLPIGILVSDATGMPFSLLPMLMFHASQLFIDTWVADRMKKAATQSDDGSTSG